MLGLGCVLRLVLGLGLVVVAVPARGLDLDVLADHVEAARLGELDVIPG